MITEIITSVLILFAVGINAYLSHLNKKIYDQKTEILEGRIEHLQNLYTPVLKVIETYYADREDYQSAQNVKELLHAITKTNESLNQNKK